MPLFEIVGFTSTETNFNVGFAWVTNEKEDNFIWALQQCRSLLRSEDLMSKVILTDRDTALMNVVKEVFPSTSHMVCRFHVEKNVSTKAKEVVKVNDLGKASVVWDNITYAFKNLMSSPTVDDYTEAVMEFRKLCLKWPKFLHYVETTVLDTDKEKFVSAWVDKYMHMGNYTTNRVESAHGTLKKFLTNSGGDLVKGWQVIHKMLGIRFTDIQTEFGQCMSVAEHRCVDNPLYSFLLHKFSRAALDYIYNESKRVEECGMNSKKCGCMMRRNYGLPCACLIAKKMKNKLPIRLDEVYSHWKRLCFDNEEGGGNVDHDYSCIAEWQAIQARLSTSDVTMKNEIRNQLRLIAYLESTSLKTPVENAKSKGAKKRKGVRVSQASTSRDKSRWEHVDDYFNSTQATQSKPSKESPSQGVGNLTPPLSPPLSQLFGIEHLPTFMHSYIEEIVDVNGDGYCGYRALALYKNQDENDFQLMWKYIDVCFIALHWHN